MYPFKYRISLRIEHPTLAPEEISANLSLTPKISWMVGTQRKTPTGMLLKGNYESTYWCFSLELKESSDIRLIDALEIFTDNLEAYKNFFIKLRSTGGKIGYFIGWFCDVNSGEVFTYEFLSKLAELQIDLSLDIYGGNPDVSSGNPDVPTPSGTAGDVEAQQDGR